VTLNERPDRPNAERAQRDCPDAERLAEYADGLLDAEARAEIEAHLLTCPDCRAVLVETMAFLGSEAAPLSDPEPEASVTASQPPAVVSPAQAPDAGVAPTATDAPARVIPFRTRSWVTGVGGGLAAAAALFLIVRIASPAWLPSWLPPWLGGGPPLEALVAALETQPVRPVEGRLMGAGGFAYARPPSPTRGAGDPLGRRWSGEVMVATINIHKFAEGHSSARARAAVGVALIVEGDLEAAAEALEQAAKDLPEDAAVQNNLSAAWLARARWWNHPEGWQKALDAADRAIRLDAKAPEPYFNRALALEGLERTEAATRAWSDYAALDRSSGWTREADERRNALVGITHAPQPEPQALRPPK